MKRIGTGLNVRFARKNSPEMLRASHLTTTIFWPLSSCLATVLARRPRRCPLPSMTTYNPETHSQRSQSFRVFQAKVEDVEDLRFEVSRVEGEIDGMNAKRWGYQGTHHWFERGHPALSPLWKGRLDGCRRLLSLESSSTHTTKSDGSQAKGVKRAPTAQLCVD